MAQSPNGKFFILHLSDFLDRIGYRGPVVPTAEALRAIHRAYLLTVPYENLDLHMEPRRALSLDVAQVYDKIVNGRRGGWCYEMNGLLAWALREMGFAVTLLGSAVGRRENPAAMEDTHILLKVVVPDAPDEAWLADVGFGNAFLEPLPLRAGESVQEGFVYRLAQDPMGRWWFTNQVHGGAGFDFSLRPFEMNEFAAPCEWLQTAPESGFVRVTVCHRHVPGAIVTLRALTLTTVTGTERTDRVIGSYDDYATVLRDGFGLALADSILMPLWRRAGDMHAAWVQSSQ